MSRVTALGELSASIAHEVNQPLAAIATSGEACLRSPQPDEVRACVQNMVANGKRAAEIVRRVRTLTKRDTPQKTRLGLNEVVTEVASLVQHQVLTHRLRWRVKFTSGLPLVADRIELQQVILTLVINGIQAIDEAHDELRELLIEARQYEDGWVAVAVHRIPDPASKRRTSAACATLSSPPSPMARAWDSRSAVPSSKPTEDGCGVQSRSAWRGLSVQPARPRREWPHRANSLQELLIFRRDIFCQPIPHAILCSIVHGANHHE
jgi:hypothetical protein